MSDRLVATVALIIATAMQAGDATIVNVALPQLDRDFGSNVALGAWVMTGYLCATAVVAPLSGMLRRRHGARGVFAGATILFVIASLACALAPSWPAIILFRLLQGAGGGLIYPLSQAMLLDLYPRERHGRMLGIWGAATMTGPILAPALGGVVTDLASWRWAFAINLPLGLLVLWGIGRMPARSDTADRVPFDGVGVILLVMAIGALQLFLERSVGRPWLASPELFGEAAIAVIAAFAMFARARRSGFGVFRPEVLRDVNFVAAAFQNFMTSALLFAVLVFVPALGEGPLGYRASLAGVTLVPRAVLMMLTMLLVGRMFEKIDHRILLTTGWGLMASGLLLLSDIRSSNGLVLLVVGSTIQAIGAGMLFTPLGALAFSTLAADRRTDATGLYSLLRQLGCASGVALMTSVLQARAAVYSAGLAQSSAASGPLPAQLTDLASLHAYADCFRMMAVAALVVAPSLFLFRVRSTKQPVDNPA